MVPRDATVVEKLRKVGAIILGKTNLSEFCNFRSLNNTSGWSARGGQTQSAYVVGGYGVPRTLTDPLDFLQVVIRVEAVRAVPLV